MPVVLLTGATSFVSAFFSVLIASTSESIENTKNLALRIPLANRRELFR